MNVFDFFLTQLTPSSDAVNTFRSAPIFFCGFDIPDVDLLFFVFFFFMFWTFLFCFPPVFDVFDAINNFRNATVFFLTFFLTFLASKLLVISVVSISEWQKGLRH